MFTLRRKSEKLGSVATWLHSHKQNINKPINKQRFQPTPPPQLYQTYVQTILWGHSRSTAIRNTWNSPASSPASKPGTNLGHTAASSLLHRRGVFFWFLLLLQVLLLFIRHETSSNANFSPLFLRTVVPLWWLNFKMTVIFSIHSKFDLLAAHQSSGMWTQLAEQQSARRGSALHHLPVTTSFSPPPTLK